jgi:hypothetical protein
MRPKQERVHNPSNQIQGLDDERELSISILTNSIDGDNFPRSVIDDLNEIYTHRYHKRCINITYLTLISMAFGVIFWMFYWLAYGYCKEFPSIEADSFSCKSAFIFEILTCFSLSLSPFLFVLMIIFWIIFSCKNPIDEIRNDFIGFKLEGNQWENQLNYYFKIKTNCFQFCLNKKRKELIHRNFGYIILSSHGIIFDELFLITSDKNILINGILINNRRILKLEFKNYFKDQLLIYLPEQLINQEILEEFIKILKININISQYLISFFFLILYALKFRRKKNPDTFFSCH